MGGGDSVFICVRKRERKRERERERNGASDHNIQENTHCNLCEKPHREGENPAQITDSGHSARMQAQCFDRRKGGKKEKGGTTHLQHCRYASCRQGFTLGVVIAG